MPDASFYDGKSGTANINIEFGFDAKNDAIPPMYKQNFAFTIPNGVNEFVFTPKFCIAEKGLTSKLEGSFCSYKLTDLFPSDSGKELVCYKQNQVNFESSSNPYMTTKWNGEAPNPPSVKGRPQSMLGTYDANLEASNIFNDQEETGSPVWIQTPDYANNIDLAFAFPNPYPIPGNPWD